MGSMQCNFRAENDKVRGTRVDSMEEHNFTLNITSISGNELLILASSWRTTILYFNFNRAFASNQTIALLNFYVVIEYVNAAHPCSSANQ